jgi:hypothetical protein
LAGLALLVMPVMSAVAQQGGSRGQGAQVTLVYEREIFSYRGGDRRDPFQPLTQDNEMGPRFQELSLQGIIYSDVPGASLAILQAGGGRVMRARVGDVVGNSRVIEISPTRVVMAVENFGTIRQEILELPQREGAGR